VAGWTCMVRVHTQAFLLSALPLRTARSETVVHAFAEWILGPTGITTNSLQYHQNKLSLGKSTKKWRN